MHGIVFNQMQQFVAKNHGTSTWKSILANAGMEGKIFMPMDIYPDHEIQALVSSASELLNQNPATVLEDFGIFIASGLIRIYSSSIKPEWKVLDLIEHTENTMHKAVRFSDKNATPPALVCQRIALNKVVIEYHSERKMVDLGVGIIKGLGAYYNEKLVVNKRPTPEGGTLVEVTKVG